MTSNYTCYGEYDESGQARTITVTPPEHTSLETIAELVRILYRAGHGAVLPGLADTRVIRPPLDQRTGATTEYWNAQQFP